MQNKKASYIFGAVLVSALVTGAVGLGSSHTLQGNIMQLFQPVQKTEQKVRPAAVKKLTPVEEITKTDSGVKKELQLKEIDKIQQITPAQKAAKLILEEQQKTATDGSKFEEMDLNIHPASDESSEENTSTDSARMGSRKKTMALIRVDTETAIKQLQDKLQKMEKQLDCMNAKTDLQKYGPTLNYMTANQLAEAIHLCTKKTDIIKMTFKSTLQAPPASSEMKLKE